MRLFFLTLFFIIHGQIAYAQVAPERDWKVFYTQNFEVIYEPHQESLARIYANEAERSHQLLSPLFNNDTPKRTILVLDDATDAANGYATPLPRSMMYLYPVLPNSLDAISYYETWPKELVTHEYTHILNFEPANGFWKPLRFLFGSIVRPNGALPRWYLEGLAVHQESHFTSHGRLKSPFYKGMIRSMIEGGSWGKETIARINETTIPTWPMGSRPYFFGALLWNEMIRQKEQSLVGRWNERFASRVPYFLSAPPEDDFGKNFEGLLSDTYQRLAQIGEKEIASLGQTTKLTVGTPLQSIKGVSSHSPQISPDRKKLIFINRHTEEKEQIQIRYRDSNESFETINSEILIRNNDGITRLSWLADSSGFVYDTQGTFDRYYNYSDIWLYKLNEKKPKAITKGQRVYEPFVRKNGTHLLAVQRDVGRTRLVSVQIDNGNIITLYEPEMNHRISYPNEWIDGRVLFHERDVSGREKIFLFDEATRLKTEILSDFNSNIQFAEVTELGLLFTSDKTGVSNIYMADRDLKTISPITNTSSHALNGTLDTIRSQLLFTNLRSDGFQIETVQLEPIKTELTQVDPNSHYIWSPPPQSAAKAEATEPEDYNSLSYLFPQYWMPSLFSGPYGTAYSASTSGNDPLHKHNYAVTASYDTLTKKPGVAFNYLNTQTRINIGIGGFDEYTYLYGLNENIHRTYLAGTGTFYLPGLSNDWRGFLGWTYFSSQFGGRPVALSQGPTAGIKYDNATQRGFQISPVKGGGFKVAHTQYLEKIGNISFPRTDARARWYFSKWLPEFHTFYFNFNSSWSPKNRSVFEGTLVGGGEFTNLTSGEFTVRGYPTGEFIGWSLASLTTEYRFPINYNYTGWGTFPLFFKTVHGAFFADVITLEGVYYSSGSRRFKTTELGETFVGAGAELRFDTTILYNLPLTLRIGYHMGGNRDAYGGLYPFIGLAVTGPEPIYKF